MDIDTVKDFWSEAVSGKRTNQSEICISTILPDQPDGGGSCPIKVLGDDGRQYWVKLTNNNQGQRTLVNDQIVSRLGTLINAAVCEVKLIGIPDELVGTKISHGRELVAGIAHASLNVVGAEFRRDCPYGGRDDNRRRLATLTALYDWCCGGDDQLLFGTQNDYTAYSHDHGHYFGHSWNEAMLVGLENIVKRPQPIDMAGLNPESLKIVAQNLRDISSADIRDVLLMVPQGWDVQDAELNALGKLIDARKLPVAERLELMASQM